MLKFLGSIVGSGYTTYAYYDFSTNYFFFDGTDLRGIFEDMEIYPNKIYNKVESFKYKMLTCGVPIGDDCFLSTYKGVSLYNNGEIQVYAGMCDDENCMLFVKAGEDVFLRIPSIEEPNKFSDWGYRSLENIYGLFIPCVMMYLMTINAEYRKAVLDMIYVQKVGSNRVFQLGQQVA